MMFDDRLKPCPFCKARAVSELHELNGKTYTTIGCPTIDCFACIHGQTTACPDEQLDTEIKRWNRRV